MLFFNPLRALSVLCGSILLTAAPAESAKDSGTAFLSALFPITLRVLGVLRGFILINRRVRKERKGFGVRAPIPTLFPNSLCVLSALRGLF